MSSLSLQDQFAPHNKCFGCGPSNTKGLQIKSFPEPEKDQVICHFRPSTYHEAFPGVLSGGIIGTILDCHCNWSAAYSLMLSHEESTPPCTVTSFYNIKLLRPTPSKEILTITSKLLELKVDRALYKGEIILNNKVYAECVGLFVAVKEGHPAYHRW